MGRLQSLVSFTYWCPEKDVESAEYADFVPGYLESEYITKLNQMAKKDMQEVN